MSGLPSRRSEATSRAELVEIVEAALPEQCAESTRIKLLDVAESTDAVAVGWFHCDGVTCPARQARRANQAFQTSFDLAMGLRFGRNINAAAEYDYMFEPFVVTVEG